MCVLTELLQHLVALVQDEVLDVLEVEGLVSHQRQDAPGRAHHNVGTVGLEGLLVLLDGEPSKEHAHLHVVKVLAETLVLLVDLKRQLPGAGKKTNMKRVTSTWSTGISYNTTNGLFQSMQFYNKISLCHV